MMGKAVRQSAVVRRYPCITSEVFQGTLRLIVALFAALVLLSALATAQTITFVQMNSAVPQSSPSSVGVKYNSAQSAGDLNVVVVGWNDSTATVSSVTDTIGSTYLRAVGPTIVTGALSQSIYYAKNISA